MKNWIDLDAQLKKHIDRGLDMSGTTDREFKLFLYSSNFYRVSGYGHCFYEPGTDRYVGGTTARQIMDVYDLDRRVRNLVLDGIGVVEPTIRSRVAYQVSKAVGGDGYLVPDLYLPLDTEPNPDDKRRPAQINNRDKVLDAFAEIQRRDEIFIQHHIAKGEPVPFWAAIEVVSIGTFSRFLRALRDKSVFAPVATSVGIDDVDKFLQAIQNLAFLRNIAAHHGRLWNRRFGGYVTLPDVALRVKRQYLSPKTPAAALTLLAGLVDQIEGDDDYSCALLGTVHSVPAFVDGFYQPIL